ncbi:hypothetical protein [Demequina sp. NBRC 110051]|uniref:hypothetical protein n=1 Tax=Demequina sp. NBRC 110051 TaxID=1570340 RepID=UPI000A0373D1|nr:hypothetical protein [Demequina sp. NBRC 110051]
MTAEPVTRIESDVRRRIRESGMDPARDVAAVRALVMEELAAWDRRALAGSEVPVADAVGTAKAVLDNVAGLGPLQRYLDDPDVEEIWLNSPSQVFVSRRGAAELTTTVLTQGQVEDLVERMLATSGRRLDLSMQQF